MTWHSKAYGDGLQPKTRLEEMLIQEIATAQWCLQRVERADRAEIQERLCDSAFRFEFEEENRKLEAGDPAFGDFLGLRWRMPGWLLHKEREDTRARSLILCNWVPEFRKYVPETIKKVRARNCWQDNATIRT